MTIVFYVSGHGLGHASRDIEIIHEIVRSNPEVRIVVRTAVAKWFFDASLRVPIEVQPFEADTGIVQIDSLRLDEDQTARRAARFYADFDRRADEEAARLRDVQPSIVVGDIPPLIFTAAHRAAVPSVAISNFTWDWIYGGYPQFERLAPGVIERIRTAYTLATRALRLPLNGGFEPMKDVLEDIPLIARHSTRGRADTRRALGLDEGKTVVLASFGGYGLGLPYDDIAEAGRFTLIVTDRDPSTGSGSSRTVAGPSLSSGDPRDEARGEATVRPAQGRLLRLASRDLATRGLRYEDLVATADVVVSKPGYGIVSECIANGAALLYTSRGRFREHDMFVAEMPKVLRCRYISQEDLFAGRWDDQVDALLGQPLPPERLGTDGAGVAASAIIQRARSSS
jgi:L-arabinokinase